MKFILPRSTHNWISLAGATVALISFSMIVFIFVVSTIWRTSHAYLGIIIYIVLPVVLISGLLLIPLGMFVYKRKERLLGKTAPQEWPRIDFNLKQHRNAFVIFAVGSTIFLFLSAVGSYESFHYTESVEFCGTVCHDVMHPEFTTYQHSSHARVACVDCHVGTGANWYLRSKLSGVYQVYSSLAEKYPKPIATPVMSLRPARETCEQCHWPAKFYARKLRQETYYLSDEENTRWDIQLLMKTGGESAASAFTEGIHWHTNPMVQIDYIPGDSSRLTIPWVRYINLATNDTTIYESEDEPLAADNVSTMNMRRMDCMDCHNRPSHDFRTPAFFVNRAIETGSIPVELPEIKSLSIDICAAEYASSDSALAAIEHLIREFYKEDYPEIVEEHPTMIEQAVTGLQKAFSSNIFPNMKARWSAYPNHIGHQDFDGCFRCHNNSHRSLAGKVISMDCNLCHLITAQGPPGELELAAPGAGLTFRHPDGDDDWRDGLCTDCHEGLNP